MEFRERRSSNCKMIGSSMASRKLSDHRTRQRRPCFWLHVAEDSCHRHWEWRERSGSESPQGVYTEEARLHLSLQDRGVGQAERRPFHTKRGKTAEGQRWESPLAGGDVENTAPTCS